MTWHHIKPNGGMGLTEQWILRVNNAPICALKRGIKILGDEWEWEASLLNANGISAVICHTSGSLDVAQRSCEKELRLMGWEWGNAPVS